MSTVTRFTISVPNELLEAVDNKLIRGDESRSAAVRRLLEDAVREAEEQEEIDRYIRGYREYPQTEEEFGWVDRAGRELLAEHPWQ